MIASKLTIPQFGKNQVGQINVSITLTNHIDQILADRGIIHADDVRRIAVEGVVVHAGTTLLSLPVAMVDALGLPVKETVTLKTTAGSRQARVFSEATLRVKGRESTFDCLELTDFYQPLLGVFPLASLGLEPDVQAQTLRVLPMEGDDTYIYA